MVHKVNKASVRFNEFSEVPKVFNLVDLSVSGISNGVFNDPKKVGSGYRLINVKDMYDTDYVDIEKLTLLNIENKEFNKNKVQYGDIFFTRSSIVPSGIAYSNVCLSDAEDITFDGHLMKLSPSLSFVEPSYLAYKLRTWTMRTRLIRRGKQSTMTTIGQSDIADIPVELPTIEEQQKVASFLSKVDEKISLLTEKQNKLTEYKKGVMQQLFNGKWEKQDGQLTFIPPTLRFKTDDDSEFPDWEEKKGADLFASISNKHHNSDLPVLAITQNQGAIPRSLIDYNISVADTSVASYKVVEKGDFIISLRSFQGGIEYSEYTGICSPAYVILRAKIDISDYFYKYYLKTYPFIVEMQKRLEGIRDGKIISYKYFSEISIPYPTKMEQDKIVRFLSTIDQKISLATSELDKAKEWKKGLLQQMFV